jgi:hypothetical protein
VQEILRKERSPLVWKQNTQPHQTELKGRLLWAMAF